LVPFLTQSLFIVQIQTIGVLSSVWWSRYSIYE